MFIRYRTRGIVLAKTDRGEADQLLNFYTKEFGWLEVLARGIRKIKSKLKSSTGTFSLSEIEFIQGKTYKTLTDAVLLDNFTGLKGSLSGMAAAGKITGIFQDFVAGQEADEKIWQLLLESFNQLNHWQLPKDPEKENRRARIIYYYFLWNFISLMGYRPDFYKCFYCRKKLVPENIYFNPKEKCLVCSHCGGKEMVSISSETVKALRLLQQGDWSVLNRLKMSEKDFSQIEKIADYCLPEKRQPFEIK